jgi:hypothetical protein
MRGRTFCISVVVQCRSRDEHDNGHRAPLGKIQRARASDFAQCTPICDVCRSGAEANMGERNCATFVNLMMNNFLNRVSSVVRCKFFIFIFTGFTFGLLKGNLIFVLKKCKRGLG